MAMRSETIKVAGYCCYSCATTVEKEIARMKGVKKAFADYKGNTMAVEFDDSAVALADIEKHIAVVLKRFEQK